MVILLETSSKNGLPMKIELYDTFRILEPISFFLIPMLALQ